MKVCENKPDDRSHLSILIYCLTLSQVLSASNRLDVRMHSNIQLIWLFLMCSAFQMKKWKWWLTNVKYEQLECRTLMNGSTVTSPNIARPLTLRTSPSDYVTFNQIKSFLIFNIMLLLEREKQQNIFTLCFHGWVGVDFGKNWQILLKNFQTWISNDPVFKLFIFNQVFVEVNCWEQSGITFPGIFCESNSLIRSYWKFCRKCAMLGDYFCYSKTGGLRTSNQNC